MKPSHKSRGLRAMFTDTPQLKGWEATVARREARTIERESHAQLRRLLLAAYHDTCARNYLAVNERMIFGIEDADAIRLAGQHELAAVKMVGDRKSVVQGKSVSVRVAFGGRRISKNNRNISD